MAEAAQKVSQMAETKEAGIHLYLAASAFSISELSRTYPNFPFFAQHLDNSPPGSSTGHLAPKIAKSCGARGTLLNHSEYRISKEEIRVSVQILRELNLQSVICAKDSDEVREFARYEPDFVAIEPPELIGSGRAVSKVKPELITDSRSSLDSVLQEKQSTVLLCGAGIVDVEDVRRAVELGSEGILVASSVIKSPDWEKKIKTLCEGFKKI